MNLAQIMQQYYWPIMGTLVVIISLAIYFTWKSKIFTRRDRPQKDKEDISGENVRLYDNETCHVSTKELSKAHVDEIKKKYGGLGRRWNYYGKSVFAINRFYDKETGAWSYRPITVSPTLEHSPTELHCLLIQKPIVEEVWSMKEEKTVWQKYGGLLLFAGGCVLAAFLIIARGG